MLCWLIAILLVANRMIALAAIHGLFGRPPTDETRARILAPDDVAGQAVSQAVYL
ncbi:MAG: hypothetical protein E5299_01525 [Burkholderia gladioli]|nr:MAG: hypothetical protein E5299_01525 [Burkholderia gladioli]